jgi:hypothetical protein
MANAPRDENHIPALLGVSSADGTTPTPIYANPTTHRLLIDAAGGVTGPGLSTDNAIARWDGTTGAVVQNSLATIDDSGNVNAVSYKAGGTAPVADGTYTVGLKLTGGGVNGTITTKGGIITAIQQAT